MSLSSQESKLAQLREALAQTNSEYFLTLAERRKLCLKIQEFKVTKGRYGRYDPEREVEIFALLKKEISESSIKELLAFSLVMEDQALALAPGSYPTWSSSSHLNSSKKELYEMINPLLLKKSHPDLFAKLDLTSDFQFLKDL